MSIVVFEDPQCELLAPITLSRLAATISCGSLRLVDIVGLICDQIYGISRPHLQTIQRVDYTDLQVLEPQQSSQSSAQMRPALLINARTAPTKNAYDEIRSLYQSALQNPNAPPTVLWDREHIVAVLNPPWSLNELAHMGYEQVEQWLEQAKGFDVHATDSQSKLQTFSVPHEVIATNMTCIGDSLQWRIANAGSTAPKAVSLFPSLTQVGDGVFVADGAVVGDYVLTDTRKGPIIIDKNAQVGPYTLLRGPIYIGPKTRILEHSAIKDAVSLAHTTKIGGEVEASIVEPFTNKQHHGFLGHSYLGSWINLGAGTCNSDLKNTYGTVNMEYGFGKATTNMQFLGCIMGDYSKTAINTGIFTGKVIGVCSMMYGFVTSNVPSFVNYARLFGQMASLPPEVMVSTQQRMFARRDVKQRGCDVQLIYDMHRLTQSERDRFGDALAL